MFKVMVSSHSRWGSRWSFSSLPPVGSLLGTFCRCRGCRQFFPRCRSSGHAGSAMKLCRAGGDFRYGVALMADGVSLWVVVSSHLIVCCRGKRVPDGQSGVAEQLHRVEECCSAHLELAMLPHHLHEFVDGEDAIGKTCNAQYFIAFRSLAHGLVFHVASQTVAQRSEGCLFLVHNQGAKVQLIIQNSKLINSKLFF